MFEGGIQSLVPAELVVACGVCGVVCKQGDVGQFPLPTNHKVEI